MEILILQSKLQLKIFKNQNFIRLYKSDPFFQDIERKNMVDVDIEYAYEKFLYLFNKAISFITK